MEKQFTTKEMEETLIVNGWFEMQWTTGFWGNMTESGFWPTKDAFAQIDRINELHHELTKGWKFIQENVK